MCSFWEERARACADVLCAADSSVTKVQSTSELSYPYPKTNIGLGQAVSRLGICWDYK